MASSRYTIQMNFDTAKAKASELEEIAESLGTCKTDLNTSLTAVSNAWESTYSQNYLNKGATLEEQIDGSKKQLNSIASTIRVIAQNIYDAEMEALRIAEEREAAEREAAARRNSGII